MGVTLTEQGLSKLNQAKSEAEVENNFQRYTLEALSEKTGLTPTTLSKIFTTSSGVDKRTLICCFDAFNLTLLKEDYIFLKPKGDNLAEISSILLAKTSSDREKTEDHEKVLCDLFHIPGGMISLYSRYKEQIGTLIALFGGHPYRLQLAFYSLYKQTITLEELLENPAIA